MNNLINIDDLKKILPVRSNHDHKGRFGHLLVIAGSRYYTGAGKLSAYAGMHSGVGLVTLAVPATVIDVIASSLMEIIFYPLPSTKEGTFAEEGADRIIEFSKDKNAVLLGPGLSQHPSTINFVKKVLPQIKAPLIIDADGLNAISDNPGILRMCEGTPVLTPHPGEMSRLIKKSIKEIQQDREQCAIDFARQMGVVVVLKGYHTVIANPDGAYAINTTGGHGLSKGGTGDVLAGLIAGLVAQGMSPYHASQLGVWLHGRAGDLAEQALHPRSMTAGDLFDFLHQVWRELDPQPYD
ncbi:MAG: NAD(P)H-hydrate dehydratase [Candidatus Hydrogenedens sp.]